MRTYRIRFLYQDPLTRVPTAQAVFGALCHGFMATYGKDALEDLLSNIAAHRTQFALSSMFLSDTLPFPLDIEAARLDENDLTKETLSKIKKLKKVRFISNKLFYQYKRDTQMFNATLLEEWLGGQYRFNSKHQLLHHVDEKEHFDAIVMKINVATRNKWGLVDDEKELFYTASSVYSEGTMFDCYILLSDELKQKFEHVLEKFSLFVFGGLQSIGYNVLKYVDFKSIELPQAKTKVLLSNAMIIPSEIDLDSAFYRVGVIESRYDNIISDQRYRKPIAVYKEGSVFALDKVVIGDLVKSVDGVPDYQNALGLLI